VRRGWAEAAASNWIPFVLSGWPMAGPLEGRVARLQAEQREDQS